MPVRHPRRLARLALVALCCGALPLAGCTRGERGARPPNVLLIVIDTLRADRLGAYGNPRGLTPFLDTLAARGTVFTNAYAPSSWTCPSVASLLTSRLPTQHHVVSFAARLSDEEVTFAERLAPLDYAAGGFSANFRLVESLGYAQGFAHWEAPMQTGSDLSGPQLRQLALRWLDGAWRSDADHPALLYLQYMEPHAPYDPPAPFRERFAPAATAERIAAINEAVVKLRWFTLTDADSDLLTALYDAEVATIDDELRQLFADLEARRFLDDAVVIITADHGEEFWEHGNLTHGISLYGESVRVPLLILGPGVAAGRRVDANVSLIDVAPTLLALLGQSREPRFEGRSLAPLLRASTSDTPAAPADGADRVLLQLEATGDGLDTREHTAGLVDGSYKLLERRNGSTETYDLASDPAERHAAAGEALRDETTRLRAVLAAQQATLRERAGRAPERATLDAATREKLRALGYHF